MEQHDVELQQPRELSRLSEGFSSPWNVLVLDRKPNSRRGRVGDADRAGSSSTLDVGLGGSVRSGGTESNDLKARCNGVAWKSFERLSLESRKQMWVLSVMISGLRERTNWISNCGVRT